MGLGLGAGRVPLSPSFLGFFLPFVDSAGVSMFWGRVGE